MAFLLLPSMTKLVPLVFLLILIAAPVYSQNGKGSVEGQIIDIQGAPVDFAIVHLSSSGKLIKQSMSEKGGKFLFAGLTYGTYSVKVSFIGFLSQTIHNIVLNSESRLVALKPIHLRADAKTLQEVTVTDQKSAVEYTAEKITFNVDQSLLAEGSVVTDLLKNVPMVDVDINGHATIAGKRNTRINIDGKPSDYMTSNIADLLNVIPSDAIEKIEVLTSPPAKYSSDGDGTINIVLRKGFKIGFNGSLSSTGTTRGNYNGSAYVAYRTKNLSLSSNYGMRENKRQLSGSSFRETFTPDTTHYLNQMSRNRSRNAGHNIRTSIDWDINERNNLRFSGNLNFNGSDGKSHIDNHYISEERIEKSVRKQDNDTQNRSLNGVIDIEYTLKMKKNKEEKLTFGVTYNSQLSEADRYFVRTFFRPDGTPTGGNPTLQRNDNEVGNEGIQINLDYERPGNGKNFEAGLQASLRQNGNNQYSDIFNHKQQIYLPNDNLISSFTFNEEIYAGYASYRRRTKGNWGFRLGGRAELTSSRIHIISQEYQLDPYINFFPNFSVNRFLKKNYNIGATYSMRISRPRENALNPTVENSDPVNISYGNPALKPSFTHQFDLSFGTYNDSWSLSPRISYATTTRIIERFRTIDTSGVSRATYENLASSKAYTVHLSGNYRPNKTIRANAGVTLSRIIYDSKGTSVINRNGLSFRSKAGLSMLMPKRSAFEANLNYYSNTAAQGRDKGSVSTNFSARKSVLDSRLNIRFSAVDPFNQRNTTNFTEGENFRLHSYSTVASRSFSITLNYRFTKMGRNSLSKQKKDRSAIEEKGK